jgi:hypothetical protein
MLLDDPQGRREEIKLLSQSIQQVSLVREVQSRFATRGEHDKRRWPDPGLRKVLDPQPRHSAFCRRGRGPTARLRDCLLKEIVQL